MPVLERELGPGVADALARTAEQLREDAAALDALAEEWVAEIAEHAEAGIALPVAALAANPPALRQRVIRLAVEHEFATTPTRVQTLAVARLVTDWHGQGAVALPGIRVERREGRICFSAAPAEPAAPADGRQHDDPGGTAPDDPR
jgi:tRNA(Ile)-lysidine synthase